ncbi:MAG: glycosyltransferase family 9 protein [Candidatus Woesearchaeota archaeon]
MEKMKRCFSKKNESSHMINFDYLKLINEIPLALILELIKTKHKQRIKYPKRILIVNIGLIGDFVVSLPALKSFMEDYRRSKFDIVVSPVCKDLGQHITGIDNVYSFKSVYGRNIEKNINIKENKKLSRTSYDYILIMRCSWNFFPFLQRIKYKHLHTYSLPFLIYGLKMAYYALNKKAKVEQWKDINFKFVNKEIDLSTKRLENIFDIREKDIEKVKKIICFSEDKNRGKIVIHLGSGWKVKLWENEKWVSLIKRIDESGNFCFYFVGGNEEKKMFDIIKDRTNAKIYSFIGRMNLYEVIILMRLSDFFIGVDSGPRNMADVAGLKGVHLLGPGIQNFMPIRKESVAIRKRVCTCANLICTRDGECIKSITVDDVFNAFMKLSKK